MLPPMIQRNGMLIPRPSAAHLAGQISHIVNQEYPGRPWHVRHNEAGGVVEVQIPSLSEDYGVVLRLPDILTHDEQVRMVRHHCGEYLERFESEKA